MERDSVQNEVGVNAVDDVRDKEETEEEAMERYFQEIDDMLDDPERIEANERWTERVQAAKEGVDEPSFFCYALDRRSTCEALQIEEKDHDQIRKSRS